MYYKFLLKKISLKFETSFFVCAIIIYTETYENITKFPIVGFILVEPNNVAKLLHVVVSNVYKRPMS